MSWNTVLFDLDGTLTDPKVGITTAVARALAAFGIRREPDELTDFIGPPLEESFMGGYGMTEEQAAEAVQEYRAYYNVTGWLENVPYEGIAAFLAALKERGKMLLVATSKPEALARRILEHFELADYFSLICGAHPERGPSKKADVVAEALARSGAEKGCAVMVGDRKHDVIGARENGIPCVGVLYGYGSREELESAGAAAVAADLNELLALLCRNDGE